MLQVREHAPTLSPSDVFTFGLAVESIKELGGASHEASSIERAKKKMMKYHWAEDILIFKVLVVPKPEEKRTVIEKIYAKIGHFGELRTFEEVTKHFF
jgi:hypothetical protein